MGACCRTTYARAWPLQQLAALVPNGRFSTVPDVPHDFWSTDPDIWVETIARACADFVQHSPTDAEHHAGSSRPPRPS